MCERYQSGKVFQEKKGHLNKMEQGFFAPKVCRWKCGINFLFDLQDVSFLIKVTSSKVDIEFHLHIRQMSYAMLRLFIASPHEKKTFGLFFAD